MVAIPENYSRRSSADSTTPMPKATAMFISLPDPRILSPKARRVAVTPPSVLPPSVSTDSSSSLQCERDRCKSPSQKASALLAKVAVLPSIPGSTSSSGLSTPGLTCSSDSTPSSTPGERDQFSFTSFKQLPHSPNGGYISFPDFDDFSGCGSEDEDAHAKKR